MLGPRRSRGCGFELGEARSGVSFIQHPRVVHGYTTRTTSFVCRDRMLCSAQTAGCSPKSECVGAGSSYHGKARQPGLATEEE
eukprot:5459883-Prymnesium_polylepis.1